MIDTLEIDFILGRNEKILAIVRNFPGLDAEMNEQDLRSMANELVNAAQRLAINNK